MPDKRHRVALAATALVAVAAGGLFAADTLLGRTGAGDVLTSDPDHTFAVARNGTVGQVYIFGILDVTNTSGSEVRFVDVRPVDPTPGLVIDSIRAVDNCGEGRGRVGVLTGPFETAKPGIPTHPISAATIAPESSSCWYFVVTAHADTLGRHECRAFDLVYTVNGREGTHRRTHGIAVDVTTRDPDPRRPTSIPSPTPQ